MQSQLKLLNGSDGSKAKRSLALDPATRARGLAGVAEAKKALEQTHPPEPPHLRQAS
jgi:hypothetical protein